MTKKQKGKLINRKVNEHKISKTYLDTLWREIVLIKAGYKCEISGDTKELQAHHYYGKSTNALRYNTDNGICLTKQNHILGIHSHDPSRSMPIQAALLEIIINRSPRLLDKLMMQKNLLKVDLKYIKIDLENQLKELKNNVISSSE
jgi:hypothetical protein